jgi:hypothetical protein
MPRVVSVSEPVGFSALINWLAEGLLWARALTLKPGAASMTPEKIVVRKTLRMSRSPMSGSHYRRFFDNAILRNEIVGYACPSVMASMSVALKIASSVVVWPFIWLVEEGSQLVQPSRGADISFAPAIRSCGISLRVSTRLIAKSASQPT